MRATIQITVKHNTLSTGSSSGTMIKGNTIDERIINTLEDRTWCHNVTNINNFNKITDGFTCDVEYNQA